MSTPLWSFLNKSEKLSIYHIQIFFFYTFKKGRAILFVSKGLKDILLNNITVIFEYAK